jgi:hypothetical protein
LILANGGEVENWNGNVWWAVESNWQIGAFTKTDRKFRLKPRTIALNGIEVPAPFEPKEGERFYYFSDEYTTGYASAERTGFYGDMRLGVWRTEEEIKQVVEVLRSVFK